jgi:hypothetical protein
MNKILLTCLIIGLVCCGMAMAQTKKCPSSWFEFGSSGSRFCGKNYGNESSYLTVLEKCPQKVNNYKVGLLNILLLNDCELLSLQSVLQTRFPRINYFWV